MQRNQWLGDVLRHRGLYDVLCVSRVGRGVVLDRPGRVTAALDVVSDASGRGGVAIVMYTPPGAGQQPRPVLVGEAALLSLGRGHMVDPSWLGAAFPGGINASVAHFLYRNEARLRQTVWSLRPRPGSSSSRAPVASSVWLSDIATVLCLSPGTSFVVDPSLCDGVEQPQPFGRASLQAGGRPVAVTLGVGSGQHLGAAELSTTWVIRLPLTSITAAECPLAIDATTYNTTRPRQPVWLLGRGSRELHTAGPAGGAEVALARRLSSCKYARARLDMQSNHPVTLVISALAVELSQRYRRDLFQVDPPVEPVPTASLILAALVVLPEAAAVLMLLLRPPRLGHPDGRARLRWRSGLTLMLLVVAGAIALTGLGYLDGQERTGAAWRAATVRTTSHVAVNDTEQKYTLHEERDYRGRLTWHTESLYVVARTGYRPHLTRGLLIGSFIAFVALIFAVLSQAAAAVLWQRWRLRPADGDAESAAVGASPPTSPPASPNGVRWRVRTTAARAVGMGGARGDDRDDDGGGNRGGGHWSLAV